MKINKLIFKTMRKPIATKMTLIAEHDCIEGESIERMIERQETTKQPIENTSPIIFTPRKDGVRPEYDIRTDRWDIALNAMDKVTASYRSKRDEWIKSIDQRGDSANKEQQPIAEA